MPYQVASVPFLNARPLVWALEQLGEHSPVRVAFDWPSRLPALLESGSAQAVLVSSIDAISTPGRKIVGGASISSRGRVRSVRLFSKVPFDQVSTLALDASSLTSNALARLVLLQMFGCEPTTVHHDPNGTEMLTTNDACILIGDKGLMFEGSGLYELDLGEAWTAMTNLPFVWACWVGDENLSRELAGWLVSAREIGERNLAAAALTALDQIPAQLASEYLTQVFDYGLQAEQIAGLDKFRELLKESGLLAETYEPRFVEPLPRTSLESVFATSASGAGLW